MQLFKTPSFAYNNNIIYKIRGIFKIKNVIKLASNVIFKSLFD